MNEHAPILNSSGNQVALLLSGSWRRSPPTLDVPASSLTRVLPLLVSSGVGALAWWRLRNASAIPTQALLREIYLRYAVSAVQHQEQVRAIVEVLRSHGIDPILVKGWAVARLYGEAGLRPSGDIDLIVPPTQRAKAESAIKQDKQCRHYWIDFDHAELAQYHDDFRELYERSEIVDLDGSPIRVLGPEDQLRFLCLHFLKHGATRPLWLCDIGAALESKRPAFDWDLFLGKAEPSASWIACTVILAQQLLGAEV